jgi:hypothetical protein
MVLPFYWRCLACFLNYAIIMAVPLPGSFMRHFSFTGLLAFTALLVSSLAQAQSWQSIRGSGYSHPNCYIGMATADIPTKCAVGKPVWNSQGRFVPVGVYAGMHPTTFKHLITTPQDAKSSTFGCYGTLIGPSAQSLDDGESNTNAIIAASCTDTSLRAAQVCRDLGRQWYLPAYRELIWVLRPNKLTIGGFSWSNSSSAYDYWATEQDSTWASGVSLEGESGGAMVQDVHKNATKLIRCVRGF